ncbi:MAG: phage tail tape measure protein, partial [Oscillospiraceae bacterium]|nr:phage tail tape measure protein [Oscillospiraceae bacterium]
MAENIVLSVQLQGADTALAQLTQLDSVVTRLKANRNVKISVNARSLATAANNAQTLNTNLSQVTQNAKTMGTTGAQSVQKTGQAIQKASRNAESFNTGMGNVVLTMAKFRLASAAINVVATGFKDAFAEMKRVDSEMVTIRKVTGYTADEMERLSQNAYSLASKYGRTASEVMAGESVFARAGYTSQIEQLSELSLLLQNVGDLQADDAAKFLIATDAAYKFGGSQEKLMAVVDGLNEITNKHATDMQKMTEGMTVAGSVFAESGESIETFAALLGAATAKTQRSGSEMARGLRTILMNLRQ